MKRFILAAMFCWLSDFALAAVPTAPNYQIVNLSWFFEPSLYGGAGGAAPPLLDSNGYVEMNCMAGCTGGGGGGGGGAVTAASGSYAAGALADGASINLGSLSDAAWGGSGNGSVTAILKGAYGLSTTANTALAAILALQPALNGDGGELAHVTNFPATQPVSLASLPNVTIGAALPAGTNNIGSVSLTQGGTALSTGNGLPTTDTADATLIANTTGLASAAKQPVLNANGSMPVSDPNNASYASFATMTVGTTYTAGRAIQAVCTAAGNVSIQLTSADIVPVNIGLNIFGFAATAINASGTTATCTYGELN